MQNVGFLMTRHICFLLKIGHFYSHDNFRILHRLVYVMFTGSGDYQVPSRLALDDCGVTEAGPTEQIESLCSKVQELDMSKNRVTDWLQVLPISSLPASVVC